MSLESRLLDLISSIGADIKSLFTRAVPPGGAAGQVLTKSSSSDHDVSWATVIGGSGDVTGPDGAPQHSVPLFEGTSGKLLKASPISFYEASDASGDQATLKTELGEGKATFELAEARRGLDSGYPGSDGWAEVSKTVDLSLGKRALYSTGSSWGYGSSTTDSSDNYVYAESYSRAASDWSGAHFRTDGQVGNVVNSSNGSIHVTATGLASVFNSSAVWRIEAYATPADSNARFIRFAYMGGPLDFATSMPAYGVNSNIRFSFGDLGQFGIGQSRNYGTAGQVLTSGGPSAAPSWQTPSGGDVGITYSGTVVRLTSTGDTLVVGASADDGSGAKLQVTGQLAMKHSSHRADAVLRSDANGLATWGRRITHGTTAPTSPAVGDIWFDTTP